MEPELPRYSLLSAARWTVVLSIALATADNFADPDLWMHILTGQTILHTGHIPRFDTYSYSAAGMPWHNHEWLSQVAIAFCYAHLGVFGLKLLKVLCASVTIVALAIGISVTGAPGRVQRLTLILSAVALSTQMQFRPQLFTFMMLSVVMAVNRDRGLSTRRDALAADPDVHVVGQFSRRLYRRPRRHGHRGRGHVGPGMVGRRRRNRGRTAARIRHAWMRGGDDHQSVRNQLVDRSCAFGLRSTDTADQSLTGCRYRR